MRAELPTLDEGRHAVHAIEDLVGLPPRTLHVDGFVAVGAVVDAAIGEGVCDPLAPALLMTPTRGHDPEFAQQLRELVARGAMGTGVMATDDCRATFEELSAAGVTFMQEPTERPYGIEAVFRDDSGNWFSLTQRFAE